VSRVVYANGSYGPDDAPTAVLTNGGYDQQGGGATPVTSVAGQTGAVTLTATNEVVATFTVAGALSAVSIAPPVPAAAAYTLTGVRLAAGTAPVGAAVLVDVNKNGTTVFTTQGNRPTIADGATSGGPGAAPNVTTVAAGDKITIDVDQIGSGTAGSDLVVVVLGTRAIP
jgi:hypothetical protein